jgi:hypothetical protein
VTGLSGHDPHVRTQTCLDRAGAAPVLSTAACSCGATNCCAPGIPDATKSDSVGPSSSSEHRTETGTVLPDPVTRPAHYTSHPSGIEPIELTQHMSFCLGNVVKYVMRAGLKGDAVEDLRKARTYLDYEIGRLESQWDYR